VECLSRDVSTEFIGKKKPVLSSSSSSTASSTSSPHSVKNFYSQQNLNGSGSGSSNGHRSKYSKYPNHSWENLQGSNAKHTHLCRHNNFTKNTNSNWIVNHNGRILLELNMLNCNRAKLPIASQTAKILKNCTDNDVIRTTKKIHFLHESEENHHLNGNAHE
jgi:hypothetical protein